MTKNITSAELDNLIQNHRNNPDSPCITNTVTIELVHLEEFINKARRLHGTADFDAIKIFFIRYPLTSNQSHINKLPDRDLSQISLAFVPAKVTDPTDWIVRTLKKNNNISTLLVCEPANTRDTDDRTGACPPKPPGCQEPTG